MSGQIFDAVFSDVGSERAVPWEALGLTFEVRDENDADRTLREEFVATLQIVLSDLEEHELLLLPTHVAVAIDVHGGGTQAPVVTTTS